MSDQKPFNPIEIPNIALCLALEVLEQPVHSFPPAEGPVGAGVYLLYYCGDHSSYRPLKEANSRDAPKLPIYIGKAERKGKRKGRVFEPSGGREIRERLSDHKRSIARVDNLDTADFVCRFLVIEDSFIGLAESVLVAIFEPLWNTVLDGFGSNPTGKPRSNQRISRWDSFHSGRKRGLGDGGPDHDELERLVGEHFSRTGTDSEERLTIIRRRIEKYGLG